MIFYEPYCSIMKLDANRTRCEIFDAKTKKSVFLFLRMYCGKTNLDYKQGLNEVLSPFLCLKKANVSDIQIYNLFSNFMQKYLRNFYENDVGNF
jgi:hypothetical protein